MTKKEKDRHTRQIWTNWQKNKRQKRHNRQTLTYMTKTLDKPDNIKIAEGIEETEKTDKKDKQLYNLRPQKNICYFQTNSNEAQGLLDVNTERRLALCGGSPVHSGREGKRSLTKDAQKSEYIPSKYRLWGVRNHFS